MTEVFEQGILIVDDEEMVLKALRRLLKNSGFSRVVFALDAGQGLKLLKSAENPFFLIISDQNMPGMTGCEFLESSISLSPESRRILITGFSDSDVVADAVNRGSIHQYIKKPWDNAALIESIKKELGYFESHQKRKQFQTITARQNQRLFNLAKQMQAKEKSFQKEMSLKKEDLDTLKKAFEELASDKKGENLLGLSGLLSRNIIITPESLVNTYQILQKEVSSLLMGIARKNNIVFFPEAPLRDSSKDSSMDEPDDDVYDLIDLVIDYAGKRAEPLLATLETGAVPDLGIDDYDVCPDIGELACHEGMITREELEMVKDRYKGTPEASEPSMDKILVDTKLITRINLSRLLVKKALIEIRLQDRKFAKELLDRNTATQKQIDQAFIRQLNRFENSGECVKIGDILVEDNVILPELRDEMLLHQNRLNEKMGSTDSPLQTVSSRTESYLDLQISDDRTKAYVRIPKSARGSIDVAFIKEMIKKRGIQFGVVEDKLLRGFLKYGSDIDKDFTVAMGRAPEPGTDARIHYTFDTDYQLAGIVGEDGSIDFRNRGDIPFVREGDLLAEKIPMQKGNPGRDVFGDFIPMDDVDDLLLRSGKGTQLSEDELKLFAVTEGQPSIDVKGVVSVLKELIIKENVDYNTGHINFSGNVSVYGVIKEGFRVNCVDLTVNEIHGGIIETSGDVNVSNGIIDSTIRAQGNVQGKFVNNSTIEAFGDITVSREIMGSDIAVSGACNNENGRITASSVAAKKGCVLGQVGTERSDSSTIKPGLDEHMERLTKVFDKALEERKGHIDDLEAKKKGLEEKTFGLHKEAADRSFTQEKKQQKIAALKEQAASLKRNKAEMIKVLKEISQIEKSMADEDKIISAIFDDQDTIMKEIEAYERQIKDAVAQFEELEFEKKAVLEMVEFDERVPVIKVTKKMVAGTKIVAPASSMVVRHTLGPCRLMEMEPSDPDDIEGIRIVIQNL